MESLVNVHSSLLSKHIKYFENVVTVDIDMPESFEVSVIWNDITRLDMMSGIPAVLKDKASVFIDYETLYNLKKDISRGSRITGKSNKFEDEKTYEVDEIYFDKQLACKVCFLRELQDTDFSDDL